MPSEFRRKVLDCLSEIRRIFNNLKYFQRSKIFLGNLSFIFDDLSTKPKLANYRVTVIYIPRYSVALPSEIPDNHIFRRNAVEKYRRISDH